MALHYLIYISVVCDPRGPAAVPAVVRVARTNNAIRGISGALTFDGERFCQYLEDDSDEIVRTFAAIERDPRHTRIRMPASGSVGEPRFAH